MDLKNKKVVLTGASGGIGQAMAAALVASGARLILVGRNSHKLETLAASLQGEHSFVAADLSTAQGRDILFDVCVANGPIDLLINNAGGSAFAMIEDQSEQAIVELIALNLSAPILLTRRLLPLLLSAKNGGIVNIGSAFGAIGYPGFSTYCATKFGLSGYTQALRRELADTGLQVFYLAPRATNTAINSHRVSALNSELGNAVDEPEVVAKALLKQLQKNQINCYVGWPEKFFARLNGLLPKLVDSSLSKQLSIIRRIAKSEKG
ncbi:MAG: SDR family oxidoreductase [Gammaproteobacteria bacterium]|nr:SDR family oxidoreductase [Gammaproteobacteria bacterium]MBQ0838810.1 SDR family oxidoreductase [Gammaproteobacteria bacterium]